MDDVREDNYSFASITPGGGWGDVRDLLVTLPHSPWGAYAGSYVESNIFPTKAEFLRTYAPDVRTVFEIGALTGFFLATVAATLPVRALGWVDTEVDMEGSNDACAANLAFVSARLALNPSPRVLWWDTRRGGYLKHNWDLVHVDGLHSYEACLEDLFEAMLMTDLILVDDYLAIEDVHRAVEDFCAGTPFEHWQTWDTVNGFAVLRGVR